MWWEQINSCDSESQLVKPLSMEINAINNYLSAYFEFRVPVCLLSARRGQYLAAVLRCVHSERGGVSIWQVRPWRVCVYVCVRLAKQRPANGHPSKKKRRKSGTTLFSSVFAMFPTISLHRLLWSRRSCRLSRRRLHSRNKKLMHLAPRSCLFWPGKVTASPERLISFSC